MSLVLGWVILSIAIGIWASNRGRNGAGWGLLALVISPLIAGLFLAVTKNLANEAALPSPRTHVKCPDCAELVLNEAKICKHCGCRLAPQKIAPVDAPPSKVAFFAVCAVIVVVVFVAMGRP